MVQMSSLVLFSADVTRAVAFYRAIGLGLEEEDHGDGPTHFATDVNGVHVAVFGATSSPGLAPSWRQAGSSFPGFHVTSMADTAAALQRLGAPVSA